MASIHQTTRLDKMASLLDSGEYSDVTIVCQGRVVKAHRCIICPASDKFANACKLHWKEGSQCVIEELEYDQDTVARLLSYIYKQSYTVDDSTLCPFDTETAERAERLRTGAPSPRQRALEEFGFGSTAARTLGNPSLQADQETRTLHDILRAHVRVYAIADCHFMPTLQQLALENFAMVLSTKKWTTPGFIDVVEEIYSRTIREHDALRYKVWSVAMEHITKLVEDEEFMRELLKVEKSDEITADLLRALENARKTKADELDAALKEVERQKQFFDAQKALVNLAERMEMTAMRQS